MPFTKQPSSLRKVATLLVVSLMVFSLAAGAVIADTQEDDDEIADEIYIDDDGNAVLVFDIDQDESETGSGEIGIDVAEGVVYALITDDLEDDVSAAFDMWVDPDSITGSGDFGVERPEEIQAFSLESTAVQSAEENRFDADLEMSVDVSDDQAAQFVSVGMTEGEVESSVDHVSTAGFYYVEWAQAFEQPDESFNLDVSGTQGDYVLEVEQVDQLTSWEYDQWETEEAAQQTLEFQFGMIAEELGGEAEITIHEHDVSEDELDRPILDISYRVEYTGLDEAAEIIAEDFANDPSFDLDEDEAREIVEAAFDVNIDGIEITHSEDGETIEGSWDIEVDNFAPVAEGMIDLIEASDDDGLDELEVFDQLRSDLEAKQAANVVQHTEWDMGLVNTAGNVMEVNAELRSDTENWADYVQELEDRGIDREHQLSAEVYGDLIDDEIVLEFAIEMSNEDLLDDALVALSQEMEEDPTVDEETLVFWDAFADADLQIAGIDIDIGDGTTTVTAAASFDDLSVFEEVFADEFHGLSVVHIYGDLSSDGASYVYATEVFDPDADETDIREHPLIDDSTEIHFVETLEDLPHFDVQTAGDFLDIDVSSFEPPTVDAEDEEIEGTDDDADDMADDVPDDDSLPGFGVIAAFIAFLLSLAYIGRR